MSSSQPRDLFGGAIVANLPSHLVDASDLRQVPDTQEVFLYPDSTISIIIELLERVDAAQHTDAVKFHFDSLAHDNSAQSSVAHSVATISNERGDATPSAIVLNGTQLVAKFNRTTPDEVRILMALYRVESKNIDLVVTINVPMQSANGDAVGEEGWRTAQSTFNTLVKSLRIVDFGLFA